MCNYNYLPLILMWILLNLQSSIPLLQIYQFIQLPVRAVLIFPLELDDIILTSMLKNKLVKTHLKKVEKKCSNTCPPDIKTQYKLKECGNRI